MNTGKWRARAAVHWLYQCQSRLWYSTSFARHHHWRVHRISVHYFLLQVNLQWAQIEAKFKKNNLSIDISLLILSNNMHRTSLISRNSLISILKYKHKHIRASLVAQIVKNPPAMQDNWFWSLGRSLGEGNGYSIQYSCLENSMDRGDWWVTVHGSQRVKQN